jgi:hypothetical protein
VYVAATQRPAAGGTNPRIYTLAKAGEQDFSSTASAALLYMTGGHYITYIGGGGASRSRTLNSVQTVESFVAGGTHTMSLAGSDATAAITMNLNTATACVGQIAGATAPFSNDFYPGRISGIIPASAVPADRQQVRDYLGAL